MDIFLRNEQPMIFLHGLLSKIVRPTDEHDTENARFRKTNAKLFCGGGVEPDTPGANFKGASNSSLQ